MIIYARGGAIASILLTMGAFYVFLNIGTTFYLLSGKSKDTLLPVLHLLPINRGHGFPNNTNASKNLINNT